jgi:hypothetical protein
MKTFIKPQKILTAILSLAAALLGLASPSASAQTPFPGAVANNGLSLRISHGQLRNDRVQGAPTNEEATLGNIVPYLVAAYNEANVVIGDGLGNLKIDDLELRNAPLDLALQALSVASGDKFTVRELRSKEESFALLYMLETNKTSAPGTKVEAFNLSGYIQHIKRSSPDTNKWDEQIGMNMARLHEIVQSVVDEQRALEKISGGSLKFEFFRESDLLIVIGAPEAVMTAGKIIRALPGQDNQRGLGYLLEPSGQNQSGAGENLPDYKLLQQLAK